MSIAPIVRTVQVKAAPPRAFDLFVNHMAQWWPKGRTIGKAPHEVVVVEPRVGGQWFERDASGTETHWGKVLTWEPPHRVVLAWQINSQWAYDPNLITEVELTFVPAQGGGTLVTLEHRNLERFGTDAAAHAETLRNGWPGFVTGFAEYANTHA
jgi:uncharacterized protein YndB with AHSA1/START domain